MKTCGNCGASVADAARFCNECGVGMDAVTGVHTAKDEAKLATDDRRGVTGTIPKAVGKVTASDFARSITNHGAALQKRRADVLFVLDCTGSMQGEIDAIRDAITSFADTIKTEGVRARVGLLAFRDRLIGEEPEVFKWGGQVFTDDPSAFRHSVSSLRATGGGDAPESSLDALLLALRQTFSPDAEKVLVLVTDAPPHIPDKEAQNVEEVAKAIRGTGIKQLYMVFNTRDSECQVYLKLLEGTKGQAFDLGTGSDFRARAEDFKRTLMSLGKTISASTR